MVSHIDLNINVAIFYLEVATLAIIEKDKKTKDIIVFIYMLSETEAEKIAPNTSHQQIAKVASRKVKTCGGFQWRYFKADKIPPVSYKCKKIFGDNKEGLAS